MYSYDPSYALGFKYADGTTDSSLKTRFTTAPTVPAFGPYVVDGLGEITNFSVAPTVSQTDLNLFQVAIPIDTYVPTSPVTASIYVTTNPNDPTAATLVDQKIDLIGQDSDENDLQHSHWNFTDAIPDSALPQHPNGTTPMYVYVVVDDGLNHPVTSPVSQFFIPPPVTPLLSAPSSVLTNIKASDPLGGVVYFRTAKSGFTDDVVINVPNASSYTTLTITQQNGTVLFSGSYTSFLASQTHGPIKYIPLASGSPSVGYDSVTVTATNTAAAGTKQSYTSSQTVLLVPAHNVNLTVNQDVTDYKGLVASTKLTPVGSTVARPLVTTPAGEGSQVTIALTVSNNMTAAGADTAHGVTVQYALPAGLTFVSAKGSGTYDPEAGLRTIGDVGSATASLTITATVAAGAGGTTLTSTATVVPGTNADKTPQVDIDPTNQATGTFAAVKPIAGSLVLNVHSGNAEDPMNPVLSGLVITLLGPVTSGGKTFLAQLGTTTTDLNGRFGFAASDIASGALPSGVYYLSFTDPATGKPMLFTDSTSGKTVSALSFNYSALTPFFEEAVVAKATITGTVAQATYPSYSTSTTASASLFASQVGVAVYLDLNHDGQFDFGDPTAVSNNRGQFTFKNLAPGIYTVREVLSPGQVATTAAGVGTTTPLTVAVAAGSTNSGIHLYAVNQATIQGHMFVDANSNHVRDPGESGLAGWTITLYRITVSSTTKGAAPTYTTTKYASVLSDPSGYYHFDNLTAGIYSINQTLPNAPHGFWITTLDNSEGTFLEVGSDGTLYADQPSFGSGGGSGFVRGSSIGNHLAQYDFGDVFQGTATAPAAAGSLQVYGPNQVTAGEVSSFTVTYLDASGNPLTGTVNLASSANLAGLPSSYTFTAADGGAHQFPLTLSSIGTATVSASLATTGSPTSVSLPIKVVAGSVAQLAATTSASITPGKSFSLSLNSQDLLGDTGNAYSGTVKITTALAVNGVVVNPATLPAAVQAWLAANAGLPATYTFNALDQGQHTFNVTALNLDPKFILTNAATAAPKILTLVFSLSDTKTAGLTTSVSPSLVVKAAPPSQLFASSSGSITPGAPYSVPLSPQDMFGNSAPSYTETVAITTALAANGQIFPTNSLPSAVRAWLAANAGLPATYTFNVLDKGQHTFNVTVPSLDPTRINVVLFLYGQPLKVVLQFIDTTGALGTATITPSFNQTSSAASPPTGGDTGPGASAPAPVPPIPVTPTDPATTTIVGPTVFLIEAGRAAFVASLYETVLGRASDVEGMAVWVADLDAGMSPTEVVADFFQSPERQQLQRHHKASASTPGQSLTTALHAERLAGDTATTPADPSEVVLVTTLYRKILNRTPDAASLDTWLESLDSGATTTSIAKAIYGSVEAKTLRNEHKAPRISEAKALAAAKTAARNAVQIGQKIVVGRHG